MPWPDQQRKAIAASLARKGKSPEQISAFFHAHGHGGKKKRKNPHAPAVRGIVEALRR